MDNKSLIVNYIKGSFINLMAFLGMSFISFAMYISMSHYGNHSIWRIIGDIIGFPLYMTSAFQVVGTIAVLAIILFSNSNTFVDNLFKE